MAVVGALAACNAAEIGPSGLPDDGKTAVFLTDAPFPFDRIERVDIHIDEIALSPQADTSEGLPTWVTVARPERTFNLLDLQNGTTALLGEADVPPGQYRAVRVRFDPDRSGMTDRDGGHPAIAWQAKGEVPSLFSLVEEPMAIDENGEDIVIDFDVGRSFLSDSSADGFIFIPFLRAITRAGSGGIEGTLVNAETGHPIPLAAVSIHYDFDTASALGAAGVDHADRRIGRLHGVVPEAWSLHGAAGGPGPGHYRSHPRCPGGSRRDSRRGGLRVLGSNAGH